MRLDELFHIHNGVLSTTLTVHATPAPGRIAFLRPASTHKRTLAGWVDRDVVRPEKLFPAGTIFVSTNGEGSHSYSYVSTADFTANSDVAILIPKQPLSLMQKLYYSQCITANRYRFSYGRKPKGHRLASIEVPDVSDIPKWVTSPTRATPFAAMQGALEEVAQRLVQPVPVQQASASGASALVRLSELFDVSYGVNLELIRMTRDPMGIPFVARSRKNNGVTARVVRDPNITPMPAGNITVAGGGNSVMAAFVQEEPYYSGRDLFTLTPKVPMTLRQKLFYCACLTANRYRFSYGRQANRSLPSIELPALHTLPAWLGTAGDRTLQDLQMTVQRVDQQLTKSTASPARG